MLSITNAIPRDDLALGLVRADGLTIDRTPPGFDERLSDLLLRRKQPLDDVEEAIRQAARDVLRNGSYKPTGRGKPASEYLVRAVRKPDYTFPRINGPVDVANYMSLQTLLPVSLWDLDRAGTGRFRFRLGQSGEAYVFNTAGQEIRLDDLVVGCRLLGDAEQDGEPIVNPVKDGQATKTTDATVRVAACVYTPLTVVSPETLNEICAGFAAWLAGCGDGTTAYGVALPGQAVEV